MTEHTETTTDGTNEPDSIEYDTETKVERFDRGVSITSKIKRGTGTRDQDEHTIKSKGQTPEEAIEYHRKAIDAVEKEFAQRTRDMQHVAGVGRGDQR